MAGGANPDPLDPANVITLAELDGAPVKPLERKRERDRAAPGGTESRPGSSVLDKIRFWLELVLVAVAVGTGVFAYLDWRGEQRREQRELAQRAFEQADTVFHDYLRLCVENPELECYHHPRATLDAAHVPAQRALDVILIDVFEVAYVNYNDTDYALAGSRSYCEQWPGWVEGMRLAIQRTRFLDSWRLAGKEFDRNFQHCVEELIRERASTRPAVGPACGGVLLTQMACTP